MARIRLSGQFSSLNDWPGRLFQADDTSVVLARTATTFSVRHGSDSAFTGYRVEVTGTGFSYLGGVPIGGTISAVTVRQPNGEAVITITGLSATAIANALPQFHANMFGSVVGNNLLPDGQMAWNHLLLGRDVVVGTADDDREYLPGFQNGNDTYNMGAGDDRMGGGLGNDTYNGGTGTDVLTFVESAYSQGSAAIRGATINVAAGTVADIWGGTDRFTAIEEFQGSRLDDVFLGRADGHDHFSGLRGRDFVDGGANSFVGGRRTGDRDDDVSYSADFGQGGQFGIVARLETSFVNGSIRGTVRDGFGNVDRVIDVENVTATRLADVLIGSRVANELRGGDGRDVMTGLGGADTFVWTRQDEFGDRDRVTDFTATGPNRDQLSFEVDSFVGMTETLQLVNGAAATTNRGTFIFNNATDMLIWDSNGVAAGGRSVVAVLPNVQALSVSNFDLF